MKARRKVKRKAFICVNCNFVYCDEPVDQCDCTVGEKMKFRRGTINYFEPKKKNP